MALQQLICPKCSGEKLQAHTINGQPAYYCPYCGAEFTEQTGIREYEKLEATIKAGLGSIIDEAFLREKTAKYYNLRSLLWTKITANYIDSQAIVNICRDILAIAQHDFLAEFFEVANSADTTEVADYIASIDVNENALLIDVVLDFIIKSLKEEYITPTAALLDKCGKIFSPEKKQRYLSKFEEEAEKATEGIYETSFERDVFLAYSSKDMPAVIATLNFIESQGLSCFAAFRNLQHGRNAVMNYERALEDAINHCSIFVFVSSVNSRNFNCDAFKKEMAYIRNTEMAKCPSCRSYDRLPENFRKLRIEYRIDNIPTPLVDKTIKYFFTGQTYAENHDQLITQLSECIEKLNAPFDDNPTTSSSTSNALDITNQGIGKITKKDDSKNKDNTLEYAKNTANFEIENGVLLRYTGDTHNVIIPYGVTRIGGYAFCNCTNLFSINIPNSVTHIDGYAFSQCKNLVNINIPNSVTVISEYAFLDCISLESINIPNSVTHIGNAAFSNCYSLNDISISNTISKIPDFLFFDCRSLTSITIPDSVTDIGNGAFEGCYKLSKINIPHSVTNIGDRAFFCCIYLNNIIVNERNIYYKSINGNLYSHDEKTLIQYASGKQDSWFIIPDTVTKIGTLAFAKSENLSRITLSSNVINISDKAFYACTNLTSINIPTSVVSIGTQAFKNCTNITSITIPNAVNYIGADTFAGCDKLKIYLYPNVNISDFATSWKGNCKVNRYKYTT